MKLLIVDDDPRIRRMLRRILENKITFDIVGEADNGVDAIEQAETLRPDVIIMDVLMPTHGRHRSDHPH